MPPVVAYAAATILALSVPTTLVLNTRPPRIGLLGDFVGSVVLWTAIVAAFVCGIRLIRIVWGM